MSDPLPDLPTGRSAPRPAAQIPEPARFWIRYIPRAWPFLEEPWIHLAGARLGESEASAAGPLALGGPPLDDVLYLPPVPAERAAERDTLARARLAEGTPVLVQALAGQPAPRAPGAVVVWDPLAAFLSGDFDSLADLPRGDAVVWPLIAGLTDDPDLWRAGCARLAARRVTCLQALTPRLTPADRRRLLDLLPEPRREAAFADLFHGEPPPERTLALLAFASGLRPFLPRPLPLPPLGGAEGRRLAEGLALAGELWLRLGRPDSQGQALFAAARGADRTGYDLLGLAREGNLGVLPWLDEVSRSMVKEWARVGQSSLLAELFAEYVA